MIALWMAYSLVVGALACVAAVAADRIVGFWNGPRRTVWLTAIAVTVLVPMTLSARRSPMPRRDAIRMKMERAVALARVRVKPPASRLAQYRVRAYAIAKRLDQPARIVWGSTSALMAVLFLFGVARVAYERSRWMEAKLNGHRVLVSEDVGPALVGFLDPRIVIPHWALDLEPMQRSFMLHHELEHLGAEDPRLLFAAGVLLVVFPWNAALWWMTQRLRLAIEIDCDTRVVQACGAPREYGLFLLAVGERRTRALPLAASLAERRSLLEKRIRAMTTQRPRYRLLASIPLAAICFGAATLVAQTPPPAADRVMIARSRETAPADRIQLSTDQVRAIVASRYPTVAAGQSNENLLTIVISSAGNLIATGVSDLRLDAVRTAPTDKVALDSADRAALVEAKIAMAKAMGAVTGDVVRTDSVSRAESERMIALKKALVANSLKNLDGIGEIDPSLVHDMYMVTFDAGAVSAHLLHVRVVTLASSSTK